MGQGILIIGESGTGKSRSMKTLDPKSTFVIKIIEKPLPFRGAGKIYKQGVDEEGNTKVGNGNLFVSRSSPTIIRLMQQISKDLPHIKCIVIDDFQYIMSYEFMARASEKSYEKFTEIGKLAFNVFILPASLRPDLNVYFLAHNYDDGNKSIMMTIGKLLDEKIKMEGIHTYSFHSMINDGQYQFLVRGDGYHLAKTPEGMFDSEYIDNDLGMIDKTIREFDL